MFVVSGDKLFQEARAAAAPGLIPKKTIPEMLDQGGLG